MPTARRRALLAALTAALAAPAAAAAALPAPALRVPGYLTALTAAGSTLAVATTNGDACVVRLYELPGGGKPSVVPGPAACRDSGGDVVVDDLRLGRTTLAATTLDSPSPHGDQYALFLGPRPRGPLRQVGEEWGWTDSDVPGTYGCVLAAVAGGGVVAYAPAANTLGSDTPVCTGAATTAVTLAGAPRRQVTVPGSWLLLGTDGKRLALARLGDDGAPTGELSLVDLAGKALPAPALPPAAVKSAFAAWLVPEGVVLDTGNGVVGPGWSVRRSLSETVAEGRLLYLAGRTVRVRRIRDGADRPLLVLPTSDALLAAGSFGLAIATRGDDAATVYRIPWRTIDRTMPVR